MEIVTFCEVRPNAAAMSRSLSDVANRLLLLQEALKKMPSEICKETGIAKNAWSQFTNPDGDRRITMNASYKLKDTYGVTLEFIYDGDQNRLPADLAAELRKVA